MANVARWLLRLEIALVLMGISVLGVTFATVAHRWGYQRQQTQVLLPAVAASTPALTPDASGDLAPSEPVASQRIRSDVLSGSDPFALGRIAIPRVGVDAIVRAGEDDKTLAVAVGHLTGTALPGQGGNIVLAAHRDTFFRGLRDIRLGDLIEVTVPPFVHEYLVVETLIVGSKEVSVLDSRGTEELTLITCHPFDFIGSAPNRFIVRAIPVSAPALAFHPPKAS